MRRRAARSCRVTVVSPTPERRVPRPRTLRPARGAVRQHGLAGPERRRRRAGQVEVVGGHAGRVHVQQGQRGRRLGRRPGGDGYAVALQVGPHRLAEPVAGPPPARGSTWPAGSTIRSIRASPATVIIAASRSWTVLARLAARRRAGSRGGGGAAA